MDKFYLNKEDAIVLVIDIQEKLMPAMLDKEEFVNKSKILISGAKVLELPVFVTEQYPKGLGKTIDEISSLTEDDAVFEKMSYTCCTSEVMDYLEKSKRKQVIITGVETHVCVYQTVRDLLHHGYSVFVASDAVSSRTLENKQNALALMKDMGAIISNTETLLFDMLKVAGTPEFKAVSKLVK